MTLDRFLELITEYQEAIRESTRLFSEYIELDNPYHWRDKGIDRSGKFGPNNQYTYSFHGIGCEFNFGKYEIDYNFGYSGRVGGFDTWRLLLFAENGTNKFKEFRDKKYLISCFEKAEKQGLIKAYFKKYYDDLFYLTKGVERNGTPSS